MSEIVVSLSVSWDSLPQPRKVSEIVHAIIELELAAGDPFLYALHIENMQTNKGNKEKRQMVVQSGYVAAMLLMHARGVDYPIGDEAVRLASLTKADAEEWLNRLAVELKLQLKKAV